MASLPIGSDTLLELKSDSLHLTLRGRSCEGLPGASLLRLSAGKYFTIRYHSSPSEPPEESRRGWLFTHQSRPLLLCGERYTLSLETEEGELSLEADAALNPEGFGTGNRISGHFTPAWEAGRVSFTVIRSQTRLLCLTCMLLPREPSLREAVLPMREALRRAAYGLTFGKAGNALQSVIPKGDIRPELWSFWCRFQAIKADYFSSLEDIRLNPHKTLTRTYRPMPPSAVRKTDRQTIRRAQLHPGEKLWVPVNQPGFDTPENRAILDMLNRVIRELEQVSSLSRDGALTRQAMADREALLARRQELFPGADIRPQPLSACSPVFRSIRGYRSFYRLQRFLDAALTLGEGNFLLPVRPLEELYRDWCFVFLHRFLTEVCGMLPSSSLPLDLEELKPSISFRHGISYTDPQSCAVLSLSLLCNRMFSLTRLSGKSSVRILFLPDFFFRPGFLTSPPPKELIEAVRTPSGNLPADTLSYGLLLYPETQPNRRPYKALQAGKPMALPLNPDWEELFSRAIKDLLTVPEKEVFLPSPLSPAAEKALTAADWEKREVLVGTLSKAEQLPVALKNRFYHAPAARLEPEMLKAKRIAIYQSSHLFGSQAGIYFTGRITEVCRVKRCEIGWLSKNSDEPYILFRVASWERLPIPILPDGEGLIHLMTTPFLLFHSPSVALLRLESETDYRLYFYLEKVGNAVCGFTVGHARILFTEKEILVFYRGRQVSRYDRASLSSHPGAIFRRLREDLAECEAEDPKGGPDGRKK